MTGIALVAALTAFAGHRGQLFEQPSVTAASYLVMDAASGDVLASRNPRTKRFPASTTKILTGLLLCEKLAPTDTITAPSDIKKVRGSSLHLMPGERVNADDMLYALMLRSANDGSHAVALRISGSISKFSQLMNERAKALGCTDSTFNNPHGLNDEKHITTALDLAKITRAALQNDRFCQAIRTRERWITRSLNQGDLLLENKNRLLELDDSAIGVKTGYTNPAGKCFVGAFQRQGTTFITVVLKSEDWVADTSNLIEWTDQMFRPTNVVNRHQMIGRAKVEGGNEAEVDLVAENAVECFHRMDQPATWTPTINLRAPLVAPIAKGQALGTAKLKLSDGRIVNVNLVAGSEVTRRTLFSAIASPGGLLMTAMLVGGTYWVRARARRPFQNNARPVRIR